MKERPINLRDWEVRAILDDRKTQLRRVVKPQPDHFHRDIVGKEKPYATEDWNRIIPQLGDDEIPCPYGSPGDRMWVREAWQDYCPIWNGHWCGHGTQEGIERDHTPVYRADNGWISPKRWRPSIHMPRWASRITLEVVSVRVERVQDISREDAIACGATPMGYGNQWGKQVGWNCDWSRVGSLSKWASGARRNHRNQKAPLTVSDVALGSARMAFANMWDADNAKRGFAWDANPWVWVLGFRRVGA